MLAKSKLKSIEILISKVLIDSNISHDQFVLINNMLKELYEMKKEIKNLVKQFIKDFSLSVKKSDGIAWKVEKMQKVKIQKL